MAAVPKHDAAERFPVLLGDAKGRVVRRLG